MERKLAFYYFIVLFFTSNLCLELAEVDTTSHKRSLSASTISNISTNLEKVQASMEKLPEDDVAPIEPSLIDTFTNNADSNNDERDILEINCTSSASVDSSVLIQPDDLQPEISTILPTEPLEIQPEIFTPEVDIPKDFPPMETKEAGEPQEEMTETSMKIMENATAVISQNESSITLEKEELNISTDSPEDIPSFSEWAQKRLEEVEKNEQINSSLKGSPVNGKAQSAKLRWKNYASLDCGAKVVAANPEAVSPGSVLSPSTDEYKLNKCTNRIWFVVELCEAIQIKKIDLANYELFSSSPKDFTVSVSDRYPTRDWSFVGKFIAKDERTIQSFDLDTHLFGKYVKIEVKSHYGAEHYCPISLFRAFGTSVFEVLQKEDPAHKNHPDDDDDDGDDEDAFVPPGDPQKNIFNSATDAVISMVKRAAEALGNKVNNGTEDRENSTSLSSKCFTPRHLVVCNDCNLTLFGEVYELLSCHRRFIGWLAEVPIVYDALLHSNACRKYKLNVEERESYETSYFRNISLVLKEKYVGAMCNEITITWNQGELNLTQQYLNVTKRLSNEKIINLEVEKESVKKPSESVSEGFDTVEPASDSESNAINDQDVTVESEEGSNNHQENVEVPVPVPVVGDTIIETITENVAIANVSVEILENMEEDMIFSTNSPQPPKESIFIRLSSRIRDLETNMSLSSQYLEELSKRYKKQVEEAQHMYDKTIQTFREDSLRRDKAMHLLEERLRNLTESVESLMAERQFFYSIIYLTFPGVLIYFLMRFFCGRSSRPAPARAPVKILRRRSVDVLTRQRRQQRRLSDQTVKYEEKNKRPTKRKRKKPIARSESKDWVADEGRIEDCPFALEENDLCALERLPSVVDDDTRRPEEAEEEEERGGVVVIVDVKRHIDFPQKSVDRLDKNVVKKEKRGLKRLLKKVF